MLVAGGGNPIGSVHGALGFLIVLVAWAAVALSPCTITKAVKRKVVSGIHQAMAILLLVVIAAQILYAYLVMGG